MIALLAEFIEIIATRVFNLYVTTAQHPYTRTHTHTGAAAVGVSVCESFGMFSEIQIRQVKHSQVADTLTHTHLQLRKDTLRERDNCWTAWVSIALSHSLTE